MLVESSFSSSIETSLLNVPEYQDTFAAHDWASLAETYQMIHKFPEQSQVSFLEANPAPDAMNLDESKHSKLQVSCPEKSVMHKVSEKALASLVYYRRKRNVKPGGTVENILGNSNKQDDSLDDSIVSVHRPGESTKRKNRFYNCLVYSRGKRRGKSTCNFTGETTSRGDGLDAAFVSEHDSGETKRRGNKSDNGLDSAFVSELECGETKRRGNQSDHGLDDAFVSEHDSGETKRRDNQSDNGLDFVLVSELDCGETKRRGNQSDNCLMYCRKNGRVKSNSCSFSKHVTGGTKVSGDQVDSSAYSQRDQTVKADDTFTGPNPGEIKNSGQSKQLGKSNGSFTGRPIGETKRSSDRSDTLLMYSRRKQRGKSTGARVNVFLVYRRKKFKFRETKRRGNQSDNCLVYCRKKGRVKSNSCSFSKRVTGGTKVSGDQVDSSAYSQREQKIKADDTFTGPNPGEIKNSGQSKQLVKSYGSFTGSPIGETKRSGDRYDTLLMYSQRKQRGKSTGARVNGFLVYRRKKFKFRGPLTSHYPSEFKKNGDQLSMVSSHALELVNNTEVTCSFGGTNDSCSSLKSSFELASSSSKTGEDDCNSSDAGISETDTDDSSSPFRQCKHCDKPGTVKKMLICDECEQEYHTSCCCVRLKEVAEIDDWICPSCVEKKSSKTKSKGKILRERKWGVTVPFIIGVRIGKEFQADVPDWSGPTMSDSSFVGEPLKIDESEYMHDLRKAKNTKKKCSGVNWLQCREEDTNGDICGKWRRAPPSEVQTKDWECYCCIFWDLSRADCAVPQELGTSEVLKQLKYMKMLRPRSDANRQKLGLKARSRSHNKGKC